MWLPSAEGGPRVSRSMMSKRGGEVVVNGSPGPCVLKGSVVRMAQAAKGERDDHDPEPQERREPLPGRVPRDASDEPLPGRVDDEPHRVVGRDGVEPAG